MLQDRILSYITKSNGLVSLEKLVAVATVAGFSELQVLEAIANLGKKIKGTVRGDTLYYQLPPPPVAKPMAHLDWVRSNYPWPENFIMPFPEMDLSWMFLRTLEERDDYKAAISGRPRYMVKFRYDKSNPR